MKPIRRIINESNFEMERLAAFSLNIIRSEIPVDMKQIAVLNFIFGNPVITDLKTWISKIQPAITNSPSRIDKTAVVLMIV